MEPESSRLTIIITSYNYARFLPAAVESALSQTLPCEVIAVDDGSTDGSLAVLEQYRDRIRIIAKANAGEASSIFTGVRHASGTWIIVLDSDDVLYPDCADVVAAHIAGNVSKLQWRLDTIGPNGEDRHMTFPHYPRSMNPDEIYRANIEEAGFTYSVTSGSAYSREYLLRVLPVPDVRFDHNVDGYLNRLAPLYGDVVTIPRVLSAYRVHGSNFWARSDKSKVYSSYLQDELARQDVFEQHAARRGIAVPEDALLRNFGHLENRLLSLRLSREAHPIPGDTKWRVLAAGLVAALGRAKGFSLLERAAWIVYLTLAAFSPVVLLKPLLARLRGITARPRLLKVLLALSRSSRSSGSRAAKPPGSDYITTDAMARR